MLDKVIEFFREWPLLAVLFFAVFGLAERFLNTVRSIAIAFIERNRPRCPRCHGDTPDEPRP